MVEAVEEAGYTGATTEIPGFAERGKPFELARLEILRESHVGGLAADLKSGEGETTEGGAELAPHGDAVGGQALLRLATVCCP